MAVCLMQKSSGTVSIKAPAVHSLHQRPDWNIVHSIISLYADDTVLFYSDKDLNVIETTLNEELVNVSEYLKVNKLTLNTNKTKFIWSLSLRDVCRLSPPL